MKVHINCTVEKSILALAKSKKINISQHLEVSLAKELGYRWVGYIKK